MSNFSMAAAGALVAIALAAAPADAQTAARGGGNDDGARGAGQKAAVDAQGRLRAPTPEESRMLEALGRMLDRSAARVTPVRRADGTLSATLPESYMESLIVKREADGTVRHACIHDLESARRLLLFPVTAPGAPGTLEEK
jgi:hypothetical protein